MPAMDVAMARSLQGGVIGMARDAVVNSLTASVMRRDIITNAENNAEDIKRTFTNWNVCMTKDYCKWPAIGVIILLSLIIIGVTICVIRCCCLGLSCCCSCFRCLRCCGNCCGCCDAPGDRPHKYSDEPFNDRKGQSGYKQQAPMEAHFPPPPPTAHSVKAFNEPPPNYPPQYAEFDMKNSDPDALPAMPVWDESKSQHRPIEEVEMENLPKMEQPTMQRMPPQRGPMPGNNMNHNAQGQSYGYDNDASRMSEAHEYEKSYGTYPSSATQPSIQTSAAIQNAYGPRPLVQRQAAHHTSMQATVFELDNADNGAQMPYVTDHYMGNSPPPQNGYGNGQQAYHTPGPGQNAMTAQYPPQDFGMGQERYASPAPTQADRRSPAPAPAAGYGNMQQRFNAPISPPPLTIAPPAMGSPRTAAYRTYSPAPANPHITNNGGFDFNSGYSRPQNRDEPETPGGYPGYKPYNPTSPTSPTYGHL